MLIKDLTIIDLKQHPLLEHFSFTLGTHDKIGIIGEEGNGKSTLLKAIYNTKLIEDYTSISGTIDTQNQQIVMFSQTLDDHWNSVFIWEYLLKKNWIDEIEDYNELAIYEKECLKYHVDLELLRRSQTMKTLSGGEKVKIRLLKVLHQPHDILLLDEPTNDLDIHTLEWLSAFIQEYAKPILFISHDETLLNECANVIIHLEQRNKKTKCVHTIFKGNYQEYAAMRNRTLGKQQQLAKKEKMEYQKKKQRLNDIQNAVHDALNDTVRSPGTAAKLAKKMKNIKAKEEQIEKESYTKTDTVEEAIDVYFKDIHGISKKVIIELNDITIQYDEKVLINHIKLTVLGKDKIVITGKNGCGKTLFIKQIYERLKNRRDIRLGYMPQNYQELIPEYATPITFLIEQGDQKEITEIREWLGRMKFTTEEMEHEICELSEGQKAKLYILSFIKQKCNVLLLDEPTRNLSPLTNKTITHILKQYDGCIISVSHDRNYIETVCVDIYEVEAGRLIQR